jgi:hypothetical protein
MRNDDCGHAVLIIQIVIELLQVGLAIIFLLDLLPILVEVQGVGASLQLLQKRIPALSDHYLNSRGICLGSEFLDAAVAPGVGLAPMEVLPVFVPGLEGFLLISIQTKLI